VAEHLYEAGWTYTSGAAAHAIGEIIPATLAAGKRPAEIREIGVFNNSGAAAEVGLGRPAAIGITPASPVAVQATNSIDVIAGNTTVATTTWGTAPTVPGTFMRRVTLQSVIGAGVIWVWNPGEFVLWSGSAINTVVLWQIGATAVTYDLYVKVAE
jgi:hypothetical protein